MSTSLIDSVANTTAHRDRDDLDRSVARLLLQFLDADVVTLYQLVDDHDIKRVRHGASITRAQDECGPARLDDLASLPRWDDSPGWRECIAEQKMVQTARPGGQSCTLFPIVNDRSVTGILEIEIAGELQQRDAVLVEGILKILRNQLALLEYGESDTLTGLLNRKTFDRRFDKLRAQSGVNSAEEPSWLGIVDIDMFKTVNDSFGHLFGDEVLLLTARLLKRAFRGADQLFRFGGEEFIVVLDHATTPGALIAFNRLRAAVEEFAFPQVGRVTISLGYTRVDTQDVPSTCVERADAALYYAKRHGRNNVQSYEVLVEAGELKAKAHGVSDVELF